MLKVQNIIINIPKIKCKLKKVRKYYESFVMFLSILNFFRAYIDVKGQGAVKMSGEINQYVQDDATVLEEMRMLQCNGLILLEGYFKRLCISGNLLQSHEQKRIQETLDKWRNVILNKRALRQMEIEEVGSIVKQIEKVMNEQLQRIGDTSENQQLAMTRGAIHAEYLIHERITEMGRRFDEELVQEFENKRPFFAQRVKWIDHIYEKRQNKERIQYEELAKWKSWYGELSANQGNVGKDFSTIRQLLNGAQQA